MPNRPDLTPPKDAADVATSLTRLLDAAISNRVSDLHFRPTTAGLELAWRWDGVLTVIGHWPAQFATNVVSRLKVLAELLTYQTDIPQEGRLRGHGSAIEMRLSTFPTLHGEKAVVRLLTGTGTYEVLDDLGLMPETRERLGKELQETSGCLVISGPAGSGKTTTAYACLREIQRHQIGKSLVTLEDPIEAELPGVSQSQVHRPAEFTYGLGLRSLMRQDPDVILVGEIRDRETAETAFQASLTGHLVITTLHAGSGAQAVTRLRDLGVEPYLLKAGLRGVLCQRLLRKKCQCSRSREQLAGCAECWQTGYRGRVLVAELLTSNLLPESLQDLDRISADELQQRALAAGMRDLSAQGAEKIRMGETSPAELLRVLGRALP